MAALALTRARSAAGSRGGSGRAGRELGYLDSLPVSWPGEPVPGLQRKMVLIGTLLENVD
jgi:hypothetical protein